LQGCGIQAAMVHRLIQAPVGVAVGTLFGAVLLVGSLVSSSSQAREVFSGPNGQLGANLSTSASSGVRAHTEVSYFTGPASVLVPGPLPTLTMHALTLTAGAGIRLSPNFELEFGLAGQGLLSSGTPSSNHYSIGNVFVGGNYVAGFGPKLRLKVGGAFAFGPWNQGSTGYTPEGFVQVLTGNAIHVYQDAWYYHPTHVHLVVPARLEFDAVESLALTLDAQPDLAIGLNSVKTGVFFVFAPGLAYWPSDTVVLGLRAPVEVNSLVSDATQVALEPSLRFNFDETGFFATRFTVNLDQPNGFSFDSGRTWGWHVALGGAF
jgi:hypothetical protein